jgi:hypothetical protein
MHIDQSYSHLYRPMSAFSDFEIIRICMSSVMNIGGWLAGEQCVIKMGKIQRRQETVAVEGVEESRLPGNMNPFGWRDASKITRFVLTRSSPYASMATHNCAIGRLT